MSAIKAVESKPTQIIVQVGEAVDNVDLQESFLLQEHGVEGGEELGEFSCWGADSRSLSAHFEKRPPSDRRELTKTLSERAEGRGSGMEGAVRRAFSMRRRAGPVGGSDQYRRIDECVLVGEEEEKEHMLHADAAYKKNNLLKACKRMFGF